MSHQGLSEHYKNALANRNQTFLQRVNLFLMIFQPTRIKAINIFKPLILVIDSFYPLRDTGKYLVRYGVHFVG